MSCSMHGMAAREVRSARVVLRSGTAALAPRARNVGGRQREAQSSRCARGAHHDCYMSAAAGLDAALPKFAVNRTMRGDGGRLRMA